MTTAFEKKIWKEMKKLKQEVKILKEESKQKDKKYIALKRNNIALTKAYQELKRRPIRKQTPVKQTPVKRKQIIKSKPQFKVKTIRHKRFLIAYDKRGKEIDRKRYSPNTIKEDKKFFANKKHSFNPFVRREEFTNTVRVETTSKVTLRKGFFYTPNTKPKIQNRKYSIQVVAKDKRTGKTIKLSKTRRVRVNGQFQSEIVQKDSYDAVRNGFQVGAIHNGHRITENDSRKHAYESLYKAISRGEGKQSKSDVEEGENIVENEDWYIEESVVYYEDKK